jgi:hypothetical protein
MVVVIEGVDGIGKSTVSNLLAERLNCSRFWFSKFPAQNELQDLTRWQWMDYVHLQTCKLYARLGQQSNLVCDRGTASNSTLRLLRAHGAELVLWTDEQMREALEMILNEKDSADLLAAEEEMRKGDVLTILLRPIFGVEWVRQRNLQRPDEPPYSTDFTLLKSFDRLYHAWQVVTPAPNHTVWVASSDSTEVVLENILKVLTNHFGSLTQRT